MSDLIYFINTVGFPIFVAVFMLTQNQKDKKEHIKALHDLKNVIERLCINCDKNK